MYLLNLFFNCYRQEEGIRQEWYKMRAEERLKAEGRLVDGEAAPSDILAQVSVCVCV